MTASRQQRPFKDVLMRLQGDRGYTLIELVVVMAIFLVVMLVTSSAFKAVLSQVGQQSKSMETQIGSIVGLELLRTDLQDAGFGLPWAFQSAPSTAQYTEITATAADSTMPVTATFWPTGVSPRTFNDATGNVPRAVQSGNTAFNQDSGGGALGSQYLVIKSLSVAPGVTQKKWINVTYSDSGKTQSDWGSLDRDFAADDRVIVVKNTFVDGVPSRRLAVNDGVFSSTFSHYTTLTVPHSSGDMFQVYGIDPVTDPRMPFNRADYYVRRPDTPPPACAPNTGILYKAVANQSAAGFRELPLLDCVADMQVVYGLGPAGSTEVNLHQATLAATLSAKEIREQLKEIRVYILAHEGKKDTGFSFPSQLVTVGEVFGEELKGRSFDLAAHIGAGVWRNYRWKVYTIVVRPKNLIQ